MVQDPQRIAEGLSDEDRNEAAQAVALSQAPCETKGVEDLEPGCCAPCRARSPGARKRSPPCGECQLSRCTAMKRLNLELRRARGKLAHLVICHTRVDPFIFGGRLLGWAGLFAHYDHDRTNWTLERLP